MELIHLFQSPFEGKEESQCGSYVYVVLTKVLWVFVHHVGQVSFSDVKFLHLLLDELLADLLSFRSLVLHAGGGAQPYPPVGNLEGTIRTVSSTDQEPNEARGSCVQWHCNKVWTTRVLSKQTCFPSLNNVITASTLKDVSVSNLMNISDFSHFRAFRLREIQIDVLPADQPVTRLWSNSNGIFHISIKTSRRTAHWRPPFCLSTVTYATEVVFHRKLPLFFLWSQDHSKNGQWLSKVVLYYLTEKLQL